MTNSEVAKAATGAIVAGTASVMSRIDLIEQYLRMAGSVVAIISGLVVIWSVVTKKLKNKREKNNRKP